MQNTKQLQLKGQGKKFEQLTINQQDQTKTKEKQKGQKQQQQQQKKDKGQKQQQKKQEQNQQLQQDQQCQQQETNSKWKLISLPQKSVSLYMIDFQHCDAKKCSGKKLQRFKLLSQIKDKKKKFKGVVLSAFGKKEVSMEDLEHAEKYGVCVVDCSWNRIEQTREFRYKHQRKLPFVTAGNPVNYGKPYQLSCAEAVATALCTIGYIDQAQYIMSKFGWADGFWSLNPLISNYAKCKTLEQLKIQSKKVQESKSLSFQRNYDLSDPQSSDEDN